MALGRRPVGAAPLVVVLSVHPERVANPRLRALQYAPALAAVGMEMQSWAFFTSSLLDIWFGKSNVRRALALVRSLSRLPLAVRLILRADVVVVLREALPLGPPLLEWLAQRRTTLVWDVDDAVWESFDSPTVGRVPQWVRATGGKYEWMARHADEVWAGSEVLAKWCRSHSRSVLVVPTVVPVPPTRPQISRPRRAGWVGTHATAEFIQPVLFALADQSEPPPVSVVGAELQVPDELDVSVEPWSAAAEDQLLDEIKVGLYPIDRAHPLAEGKCGLKAILYMSRGIPPVVTPTETNAAIVREGVDGLHAETPDAWRESVNRLLDDETFWEHCSKAGHARVRDHYSLEHWGPVVADRLRALACRDGSG